MANMFDPYFRQPVTEGEAGAWLTNLESADRAMMVDLGFFGMLRNGDVTQHGSGNMTVDLSGDAAGYDQFGQRTAFVAAINQNCALDSNGSDATVQSSGNKRWVSIFVRFKRVMSDERTDGNGVSIFYNQAEGSEILVVAGAEATSGSETKPSLRSDAILLADVHLTFGQTQILTADIDTARRQEILVTPALQSNFTDHVTGADFRHTGAMIDMAALAAWADGTTNPSGTLQVQAAAIVTALKATVDPVGLKKIGARSLTGSVSGPYSISSPVTAEAAVNQLLGALNSHATTGGAAHLASQITTTLLAAWPGGTTNPASDVQTQLGKIVGDVSTLCGFLAIAQTWTGANQFADITASSGSSYKLSSRTRVRLLGNWNVPVSNGGTWIGGVDSTAGFPIQNANDGSVGCVQMSLENIPNGATITAITVQIKPAVGHNIAGLPNTHMPSFKLCSVTQAGVETVLGTYVDASANGTAYDASHQIASGSISFTLNKAANQYHIRLFGEAGTAGTYIASLVAYGCQVTFTTAAMDDAAG